MKMLLAVFLALVSASAADVKAMCSPESLSSNLLHIKTVGIWDCRLYSTLTHPITLPAEALYLAMPGLHALPPARAQQIVTNANNNSLRSRVLRYMDYGMLIALGITGGGVVAATKTVVFAVGLGSNVATRIGQNLTAQQPDLTAYAPNVPATISLGPGQGSSFTIYASKMPNPVTIGPVALVTEP